MVRSLKITRRLNGPDASRPLLPLIGLVAVVGLCLVVPRPAWSVATPLVLVERAADGLLVGALLWLAAALGGWLLRGLGLADATPAERVLIGGGLGLGVIAYLVLALGLVGLLTGPAVGLVLGVAALLARAEVAAVPAVLRSVVAGAWRSRPGGPAVPLALVALGLVVLITLLPPVTWDGLAYHLAGPRDWLALGRLAPLLDNPPANYPATAQMIYAMFLLAGSDSAPQMLHAVLAVATVALTGLAGARLGGPRAGWLAALAMASAPAVTFFAWHANNDFSWTLAEATALYGLLRATTPLAADERGPTFRLDRLDRRWLAVAGLGLGLALGMRYLSLGSLALLGATTLALGLLGRRRPRALAGDLLALGLPALLVAAPWYVKNWLWLGNPVWPTYIGGVGWDAVRLASFNAYVANVGHPAGWPAILWLPLRLFTGDHEQPLAIPSLLFLLLPLALLPPRRGPRLALLALAAAQFAIWSRGMTEIRFLFPAFPVVSVLVGLLLSDPPRLLAGARARRLLAALPAVALLVALVPPLFFTAYLQPWRPLLGLEARATTTNRFVATHASALVLNRVVPPGGKVLLIGDGRLYYLTVPARSDIFRDALALLAAQGATPDAWRAWLAAGGYTHVLVSQPDLKFMDEYLSPDEAARRRATLAALTAALLRPIHEDRSATVYEIIAADR